jgi:hypothetical protein
MDDLRRVVGIVMSPAATFADINRRPTWLLPLLLPVGGCGGREREEGKGFFFF